MDMFSLKTTSICFKRVAFSVGLFLSHNVFGDSGGQFVKEFFTDFYFQSAIETIHPSLANFEKYEVKFNDKTIPLEKGYVDREGRYLIKNGKIITNPSLINFYINNSEDLGRRFNIFNLRAHLISHWLLRVDIFSNTDGDGEKKNKSSLKQVIYIDKDRQYVILGKSIITERSLTNEVFLNANKIIHSDLAKYLYEARNLLGGFWQGNQDATHSLYVIVEPNCLSCHNLYLQLKPYIDANQLTVYWIPVAFACSTSRDQAIAILSGAVPSNGSFLYPPTPAGAWIYHQDFLTLGPDGNLTGGIPSAPIPTFQAISQLNKNTSYLLSRLPITSPILIFKNLQGKPEFTMDEPTDIDQFIRDIYAKSPQK